MSNISDCLETTEAKELFSEYVREVADIQRELDKLSEKKKQVANIVKESLNIPTKDFLTVVKYLIKDGLDEDIQYLENIDFGVSLVTKGV